MKFSRRTFLKIAAVGGVSLATDTNARGIGQLVPYVIPPENLSPVIWNAVATTCRECPAGCGQHISHKDGRITKAEGNPVHPVNRGGLCPRGQSALQGVYDPDRVWTVQKADSARMFRTETWQNALSQISAKLRQGTGRVAIMSRLETGSLVEIFSGFLRSFGSDRLILYEAFNYEPLRKSHAALFGQASIPLYHLDRCEYIVSFGADFLETWVSNVQFAHQFATMHELKKNGTIGRFDYVGPRLSMTATNAEMFLQVSPEKESAVAWALLKIMSDENLVRNGQAVIRHFVGNLDIRSVIDSGITAQTLRTMARRFASAKASVALAGPVGGIGPEAERLALIVGLLNYAAGRIGTVIDLSRPHALSDTADENQMSAFLKNLSPDDVLIIHKTNPVFTRPGSARELRKAGTIVYLGTMMDETAMIADWFLPVNSYLESWGDYEPYPGLHSILQPTMSPLRGSKHPGDLMLELASAAGRTLLREPSGPELKNAHEWVQARWKGILEKNAPGQAFPDLWQKALQRGGAWSEIQSPDRRTVPAPKPGSIKRLNIDTAPPLAKKQAKLWLWPSIMFFDGRTANRGWMQEAPEPVSFNTWGSWIDIHPVKANQLDIHPGDVLALVTDENQRIEAPCRITNQVAEDTVAVILGQGHSALGKVAAHVGASGFNLIPNNASARGFFGRVTISKTGRREDIIPAIETSEQHDRHLMRWKELEIVKTMQPGPLILPLPEGYSRERDLYKPHSYRGHRWAMVIDLQRCIGCGACAVACYAENNIAVVGKKEVGKGREMAWLKVVPYFHGKDTHRIGWLPMLCQHCDAAPCEPVCPVFASVHNDEGLNAQVYNRCIGTRYCNNNCPYKVRRFNWLNRYWADSLKWQLNPEVTVRERGVMEKCTFCVQRIRNAEYRARREGRSIGDGEIQPACAQSCPTKVYTFGDLLDPDSAVSRMTRNDPRRYQVLQELNTKPAITYLFRIEQE